MLPLFPLLGVAGQESPRGACTPCCYSLDVQPDSPCTGGTGLVSHFLMGWAQPRAFAAAPGVLQPELSSAISGHVAEQTIRNPGL